LKCVELFSRDRTSWKLATMNRYRPEADRFSRIYNKVQATMIFDYGYMESEVLRCPIHFFQDFLTLKMVLL